MVLFICLSLTIPLFSFSLSSEISKLWKRFSLEQQKLFTSVSTCIFMIISILLCPFSFLFFFSELPQDSLIKSLTFERLFLFQRTGIEIKREPGREIDMPVCDSELAYMDHKEKCGRKLAIEF